MFVFHNLDHILAPSLIVLKNPRFQNMKPIIINPSCLCVCVCKPWTHFLHFISTLLTCSMKDICFNVLRITL